jgi:hypothetical protein
MTASAKKTGLVFGGFKPFTTGHYSRCLQSLATCDQTILVYSTKPRGENDEEIPEKALERMWNVITPVLESKGIIVRKALTTPVKDVFGFIGAIRTRLDNPSSTSYDVFCKYFSLHPASTGLALFGSYEDIYDNFGKHVGKPSERRFFGSLLQEKKIQFVTEPAVGLLEKEVGKSSAEDLTKIRATQVRKLLREDVNSAASYLFPMTPDARRKVIESLGFKKD